MTCVVSEPVDAALVGLQPRVPVGLTRPRKGVLKSVESRTGARQAGKGKARIRSRPRKRMSAKTSRTVRPIWEASLSVGK